jgi:hypothetical protein
MAVADFIGILAVLGVLAFVIAMLVVSLLEELDAREKALARVPILK